LAVLIAVAPPLTTQAHETGYKPSAYTGHYYDHRFEGLRKCIGQREGRWNYSGTGDNGRYVGTYQFTRPLAQGATWMMEKEWRKLYGSKQAKTMRLTLQHTDPTKWSRAVWDQAFWTVLSYRGSLSGLKHWNGGRYHCLNASHDKPHS